MAKAIIKSYWSDMCGSDDNTDGIYVITFPNNVDYKKVIDKAFSLIEDIKDLDLEYELDEQEQEAINNAKKSIEGTDITLDELMNWYECNQGCSLGSLLDFICKTNEGWSYEDLNIDNYFDMDYGNWSY